MEKIYFYKQNNVVIINYIERIYPLGRAKINNLNYFDNASKCFNLKLITAQLLIKSKSCKLNRIYQCDYNNKMSPCCCSTEGKKTCLLFYDTILGLF